MLWKDVDYKVATRCIISFSGSSSLFDYSREHDLYAPVIIKKIDSSFFLTLLIKGDIPINNSAGFFLKKFGGKEGGGFWYVKFPLESFIGNEIIEQINEMPSAVMGYLYLKNGRLFADFRFHQSKSTEVSGLLMTHLEKDEETAIESIFPGSGEISFLSGMNALIPLSMIKYSIPAMNDDPLEKCLSMNGGIAQVEKKAGVKYRALIYLNSHPIEMDGIRTISDEDHVYEAEGDNSLLQEIRRIGNDNVIFRASQFARVVQERLTTSVFLPSYQTADFLKILARVECETERSMFLHCVLPFSPDLFEII